MLDDFDPNAVSLGGAGRLIASVSPIDESERDGLAGNILDALGEVSDLGPFLLVGRRDDPSKQVAEGVDGRVDL